MQDLEWEDPGSSALPTLDRARIQVALLSSPAPSAYIMNFRKLTHMSNVQGTWKGVGLPKGSLGLALPSPPPLVPTRGRHVAQRTGLTAGGRQSSLAAHLTPCQHQLAAPHTPL